MTVKQVRFSADIANGTVQVIGFAADPRKLESLLSSFVRACGLMVTHIRIIDPDEEVV